ncbi:MAG: hypothetical protein R3F28_16935 [Candidatus Kapaibacterium sp.]
MRPLMFCTLLLSILLPTFCVAQLSTITMVDGEEYRGVIVEETNDTIRMRLNSGSMMIVPRRVVRIIDYSQRFEKASAGFWSLGAVVGTPGAINLVVGRHFDQDWGVRLTGGYIDDMRGIQCDLLGLVGENSSGSLRHSLGLGVGTFKIREGSSWENWTYVMGGYNLNWWGFNVDIGLSVGSGSFSNPQMQGGIGYVHQFR